MIDVLVATYNGEKHIKEQLDSILTQTYKNINIIVCDDCSSDGTLGILKQYEVEYSQIKVIANSSNIGYIKNFEKLISLSTAPYFSLCDQDDIWYPDKISMSIEALRYNDVDIIFTDLEVVDDMLRCITASYNKAMNIYPNRVKRLEHILLKNYATGCTITANSRVKKILLPFVELDTDRYIHDWLILIASTFGKGFHYIDVPTVMYRQHDDNSIGYRPSNWGNKFKSISKIRNKRKKYIDDKVMFCSSLCDRYGERISNVLDYYISVSSTKYINSRFKDFLIIFKGEKLLRKCYLFIIIHFPMGIFNKM